MFRVGVAGATGYLGSEVVDLLLGHPSVELGALGSSSKAGSELSALLPRFRRRTNAKLVALTPQAFDGCDAVILACPQGVAADLAPALLDLGVKVIDLSGDHRLRGTTAAKAYGREAPRAAQAVYGLPEKNRPHIRDAKLVANPGCYATASALALLPLSTAGLLGGAIVDGKSGVTGAGREPTSELHFPEMNEAMRAYKVGTHRHEPEIAQTVGAPITFVPHIVPLNRGLLVTAYVHTNSEVSASEIDVLYEKAYAPEPFVRLVKPAEPDVKDVAYTNYCDVHPHVLGNGTVVVTAAIDNLRKGGSGQAVQNLNLMLALAETEGLL
ncbi:MAG: N-acetyl-gamma-glutamyl-phosphate reductase [Thermoplasmatota archaeon]